MTIAVSAAMNFSLDSAPRSPGSEKSRNRTIPAVFALLLGLGMSAGCGTAQNPAQPGNAADARTAADSGETDRATAPLDAAASRPRQPPDDVGDTREPTAKTSIARTLQQQIQSSEPIEESGAAESLLGMVTDADDMLNQIKLRNREAIRQASRQVRIGAARLSPNILLILVDRMGTSELGCYGASPSLSPNIDRLAAGGMRFENAYSGGADAESGFWSLMTGRNASRAPRTADAPYELRETDNTLADVLWRASYNTMFLGVWTGTTRPIHHGFDDWTGLAPDADAAQAFPEMLLTGQAHMRVVENTDGKREASIFELLAAETASFFDRSASSSRPFVLVIRLPSEAVCREAARDSSDAASASAVAAWDDFVGTCVQQLADDNLQRRTCVIFTALSGMNPSATSNPRRTDHALADVTLRVPLVASWSGGINRDGVSDHVCAAWDLLPTCVELARVSPRPTNLDGLSFAAALRQEKQIPHALLYWELRGTPHVQAVRKGPWKGVYIAGDRGPRLYNLEVDPEETTDIAGQHPDVVKQLLAPQPSTPAPRRVTDAL